MGVTEDGQPWRIPIPVSTLTAGCTGSGKASAMWMLLLNLAPAIRSGLVQVHGVDLKGGMELGLGTRLFTRYATTPDQAVVLLEDAVQAMTARAATLAGHARSHTPSTAAPLVLVLIDELAMLTSYLSNQRDLFQRADKALRALLGLGRAPGFVVWGFLQDPRKDTVPQRHMFTQTIALRLREREEVAMVLSDGAVAAGAACHKIPRTTPGCRLRADRGRRRHPRPLRVRARRHDPRPRRPLPRTRPDPDPSARTRTRCRAEVADPYRQEPIMITTHHTATTAAETPDLVTLSGRAVAGLVELLDHCHGFLDTHQTARVALEEYCLTAPAGVTPAWVIDRLAWQALLLRLQLVEQVDEDRHG